MGNLTSKQEAFALKYAECGNASEAYRHAYNAERMKPETINATASVLKKNKKVAKEIERLLRKKDNSVKSNLISEIRELRREIIELKQRLGESTRNRSASSSNRYAVMHRAGFKCQCCGAKPSELNNVTLHIDHITPFSNGGSSEKENLQVLCGRCNLAKSNFFIVDHNEGWELW